MNENNNNLKSITSIPGWATDYLRNGVSANAVAAYMASAWAMRGIKIRANAVSEPKLCLYDKNGEKINNHPILDIFSDSEWDFVSIMRYTESGLLVHGAGYWEKERNAAGKVKKISYINPSRVTPQIDGSGIYQFNFSSINGRTVNFRPVDLIYFKGEYNPNDDLLGMSAMRWAIYSSVGELNADIYINAFWQNGATPATIISDENPMPPQAEVERQISLWQRLFGRPENQHKTGFIYGGKKVHQLGSTIKDLSLDVVRQEMHRTISTAIGVPELIIASTANTDITPVTMAYKLFYNQTVNPQLRYYESVLNSQLLSEFPDLILSGAYLEFDTSNVQALNEEESIVANRLIQLVEKGIIKPEVAAVELGYKITDVPEKEIIQPVPAQAEEQTEEQPEEEQETDSEEIELERYQKKALNALKAGKSANVKFETDDIAPVELARIQSGLANAKTREDVLAVFEKKAEPTEIEKLIQATLELSYAIREADTRTE